MWDHVIAELDESWQCESRGKGDMADLLTSEGDIEEDSAVKLVWPGRVTASSVRREKRERGTYSGLPEVGSCVGGIFS
jgi:hypothetical protein